MSDENKCKRLPSGEAFIFSDKLITLLMLVVPQPIIALSAYSP